MKRDRCGRERKSKKMERARKSEPTSHSRQPRPPTQPSPSSLARAHTMSSPPPSPPAVDDQLADLDAMLAAEEEVAVVRLG